MQIGRWQIVDTLSRNGSVTVYLVKDEAGERQAVLKALQTQSLANDHMLRLFRREIAINTALKHRNIVAYLDSGDDGNRLYCVFEYCNGGNLSETLLRMGRKLHLDEAIRIIVQVLEGLNYAHNVEIAVAGTAAPAHGVVHRDIKPENILLHYNAAGQYTAKIADFGLSKAFHQADRDGWTRTGDIGGSLAYISRQQIINYKYAKAEVDVWSTVAVLYFLLTGFPPRGNRQVSFSSILNANPRPLLDFNSDIPETAAAIIDQALDDSGILHYKTAADLKQALLTLLPPSS